MYACCVTVFCRSILAIAHDRRELPSRCTLFSDTWHRQPDGCTTCRHPAQVNQCPLLLPHHPLLAALHSITSCCPAPPTVLSPPPHPRVTLLQAYYSTRCSAGLFHTTAYLPSNAGIPSCVSDAPPGLSSKHSKQAAALRALQLLYASGKLTDHLQPVWVTQRHHKRLGAWAGRLCCCCCCCGVYLAVTTA